jgi:hypothetical protein
MSDDWENELENLEVNEAKGKGNQHSGESETIVKPKSEPKVQKDKQEDKSGDQKKIEDSKVQESAEVNKTDTTTTHSVGTLNTEKDFVDLAVNCVSKINSAKKPSKFTFSYLKHNIDLLGPAFTHDQLYQLEKDLSVLLNKKTKETSNKSTKKQSSKPTINDKKGIAKADQLGRIESKDQFIWDDEDYEEDDFM